MHRSDIHLTISHILRWVLKKRVNASDDIITEAIALAETWQNRANALMVPQEKKRYKQLARLLANPKDKILLTKLIDQSFRSANPRRVADQIWLPAWRIWHSRFFFTP